MSAMRTTIDVSEPGGDYTGAQLPDPTVISDDGDIVLCFGDVELRMNYSQFEDLFEGMTRFRNASPPTASLCISDDE
jgi:hypothetical protein